MNGASRKLTVTSLFSIALSLVLSGGIALAASSVAHTTLTIHGKPGGNVAPGTTITISGKLNSGAAVCRSGQTIELLEVGNVTPIASTVTDAKGGYSFTQTVSTDTAFQTHFGGSVAGVHPNTRDCAASTSRVLKVKVKGNGNGNGNGPGTSVLGESGSAGAGGTAFTGRDLVPPFILLALLVISGVTALLLARRRMSTRSSG